MSGLENLKTRLNYVGGGNQQGRMNRDKVASLRKALLYSYQAATIALSDNREFRCLINPDKLRNDYDDKIISIPYKDICLNSEKEGTTTVGYEEIGVKAGDIFKWKDNGSYWMIYLQRLEETAYFRAEIRRCRYELEVNGNPYRVYVRGPIEQTIDWNSKNGNIVNSLNYTLMMTIANNEETEAFFHRFSLIKFKGKTWEVQAIDNISTEGIIDIYLKEYYNNSIADAAEVEKEENIPETKVLEEGTPQIIGDFQVYPYDIKEFTIENAMGGTWTVDSNKVNIISQTDSVVKLKIITGKSGKFILSYKVDDAVAASMEVTILSL